MMMLFLVALSLLATGIAAADNSGTASTSGLIAEYKFGSDGIGKDATGNGHDGTVVGDVSSGTDTQGPCGVFNGGFIQVPSSTALDLDGPFTISVWVKTDPAAQPNNNGIISKQDSTDTSEDDYYLEVENDTNLRYYGIYGPSADEEGNYASLNFSLSDSWTLVTEVCDGSNMLLYANADLVDSQSQPSDPLVATDGQVAIGAYTMSASTGFFRGKMTDLRIYNRALSSDEIKAIYNTNSYNDKIVLKIDDPNMTVDGVQQEIDPGRGTEPTTIDDRTVVPIVAIIDAMGGNVAWDGTAKSVTITLKNTTVKMVLNDTTAYVNGTAVTMDVPATSINDRTMVPLRFVGEQLGCKVQWDQSTQQITLLFNK
jgi:hypothetical protein